MRISRRAVLLAMGTQLVIGAVGRLGAEPAAEQRYLLHISGMT